MSRATKTRARQLSLDFLAGLETWIVRPVDYGTCLSPCDGMVIRAATEAEARQQVEEFWGGPVEWVMTEDAWEAHVSAYLEQKRRGSRGGRRKTADARAGAPDRAGPGTTEEER